MFKSYELQELNTMLLKPEIEKTEWGEVTVFLKKKFESGAFIESGIFKCEVGK